MNILFWIPYPIDEAPSQRFRFEQYFDVLTEQGHSFRLQPFWDMRSWRILYRPGHRLAKVLGLLRGLLQRLRAFTLMHHYDMVFIHREAAPIGPPIFEWLVAKLWRKRIIYDFDDAIWLPNTSEVNSIASRLKWHDKVGSICRWANKVSAGNAYLCTYARQFNSRVVLNPTTIDTKHLHNRIKLNAIDQRVTIGWTGTHSTLAYLAELLPVFHRLKKICAFDLCVIANQPPNWSVPGLRFKPWRKETEIDDLLQFDIGLMPLTDDIWSQGKCGFKALQYMALGIPPLVSPVGVNKEIVDDGVNGFICSSPEEWQNSLLQLMQDAKLRQNMGKMARIKVEQHYSIQSNASNFLSLFA